MPRWSARLLCSLLVLSLVVIVVGCKKKPPSEPTSTTPPPVETAPPPAEEVTPDEGFSTPPVEPATPIEDENEVIRRLNAQNVLGTVYFDFDKFNLKPDALEQLKENAEWLKSNPQYRVRIEGNCDERGTVEYNLALGERRASAARDYLTQAGISTSRIVTISYGEEHPVDPGHRESAWSKNRRDNFVIIK